LAHQRILGGVTGGLQLEIGPVLALEFSCPIDETAPLGADA
jgi:hypothetical protein